MTRLTDEYVALYLEQLESLRKRNPAEWMHEQPWKQASEEIRERRAADLSAEDVKALQALAFLLGKHHHEPYAYEGEEIERALTVLDRLLARGGK